MVRDVFRKNIQVQQWVAILSVCLLAVKIIAYFITNSVAILTDALEGIVNVIAGFVGLYSLYVSAKPHDEDHPRRQGNVLRGKVDSSNHPGILAALCLFPRERSEPEGAWIRRC